jgi:hypothetical protein
MKKLKENATAFGVVLGVFVGIATDNIGLWVSLGICFGAAIQFNDEFKESKKEK